MQATKCDIVERVIPGETNQAVYFEHLERYKFAAGLVAGKDVLDVACGAGYGGPILCKAGARSYLGVDISSEAIALAERRYRVSDKIRFLPDDACRLSTVGDCSVDVAVSFETVEHVADPAGFFSNLVRVLRPEGMLVISTPNRAVVSPGNDLSSSPRNPFHLREWNQREFVQLLGKFFEVKEVLGQNTRPLWKVLINHQAAKIEWVGALAVLYGRAKRNAMRLAGKGKDIGFRNSNEVGPINRWQPPAYLVCLAKVARVF